MLSGNVSTDNATSQGRKLIDLEFLQWFITAHKRIADYGEKL